jgi:hypothetical protein
LAAERWDIEQQILDATELMRGHVRHRFRELICASHLFWRIISLISPRLSLTGGPILPI